MKISISVKPNSKKGSLVETRDDGSIVVYIREVAADGKANEALIKLLAKHYGVPKTSISIVRGYSSRHKVVNIN